MVGLVIVSHSAALADGVMELAREMGGAEVAIESAGGMESGEIGTDAERVRQAVERVRSPDGVLVLMDLGSAVMSAEMAVEMAEPGGGPILLSEAPLVEGCVAAAALAGAGASLEEVAREAKGALRMKSAQLEADEPEADQAPPADEDVPGEAKPAPRASCGCRSSNRLGLHARPAARFVGALGGLDTRVEVSNATRARGPADGRSLVGLATLAVAQGDEIVVRARGSQAARGARRPARARGRELRRRGGGRAGRGRLRRCGGARPGSRGGPGGRATRGRDAAPRCPRLPGHRDRARPPPAGARARRR